jgi:hypothetical protein
MVTYGMRITHKIKPKHPYLTSVRRGMAILTHNVRDFVLLDKLYRAQKKNHGGVILSGQPPFPELLKRISKLLSSFPADNPKNTLIWLGDFN